MSFIIHNIRPYSPRSSTRQGRPRPGPGPDRRRRRPGVVALHRVLHRQHPQPEHPPGLRPGRRRLLRWCESRRIRALDRSARPWSPPTSSSRGDGSPSPPSSSTSPPSGCSSTGSSIGQVVPMNPAQCRPRAEARREARQDAGPRRARRRARSSTRSTPTPSSACATAPSSA